MSARSVLLGALAGGTLALLAAVACIGCGLSSFAPGFSGAIAGAVVSAALGALASLVVRRLEPASSVSHGRLAAVGALLALLPFLLLHAHPLGFIGLNEVGAGAGPLGELALVTLPPLGAWAGACARLFGAGVAPQK